MLQNFREITTQFFRQNDLHCNCVKSDDFIIFFQNYTHCGIFENFLHTAKSFVKFIHNLTLLREKFNYTTPPRCKCSVLEL